MKLNNDNVLQAQTTERQLVTACCQNWRFCASYDSFGSEQTVVLRMKFSGKNRQLRQHAKRYMQP